MLKLTISKATHQEEIKAPDEGATASLSSDGASRNTRYYPLFFVLAGTGMRLGGSAGTSAEDVDYTGQTICIARAFSEDGALDTRKAVMDGPLICLKSWRRA